MRGEIDVALEKDLEEQYVSIVAGETSVHAVFSRLSLEVHLFDYGSGSFLGGRIPPQYLRQIEFRIAILRDKLEYLGEAFCTEEEMRLASLAISRRSISAAGGAGQYLMPSCPWWEATEEAITE